MESKGRCETEARMVFMVSSGKLGPQGVLSDATSGLKKAKNKVIIWLTDVAKRSKNIPT